MRKRTVEIAWLLGVLMLVGVGMASMHRSPPSVVAPVSISTSAHPTTAYAHETLVTHYEIDFRDDAPHDAPLAMTGPIPVPSDASSVADGKMLFRKNCAACHGATGKGDGPAGRMLDPLPGDLHFPARFQYGGTEIRILTTIWLGAKHWNNAPPTSGMAGFKGKLTKIQVGHIVAFLKHDFMDR